MVPPAPSAHRLPQSYPNFLLHHQHRIGAPKGVLNALPGAGIADPLAIHDESILVPPRWQPHRRSPSSSRARTHRRSVHVPIIESPRYRHRLGLRPVQSEFDWLLHWPLAGTRVFGRYGPRDRGGLDMSQLHHKLITSCLEVTRISRWRPVGCSPQLPSAPCAFRTASRPSLPGTASSDSRLAVLLAVRLTPGSTGAWL